MSDSNEHLDLGAIRQAVESFMALPLGPMESLIAASEIAFHAAQRFREEAKECRRVLGQETARELAISEIAEAITRIQDASAPAVHGYNDLLRDQDDERTIPFS